MQTVQFRDISQLNRVLIILLMAVTGYVMWQHAGIAGRMVLGILMGAHLFLLMANEFFFKTIRRYKALEFVTASKLTVLLPLVFYGHSLISYVVVGSFSVYLLGLFGMLQAHYLGAPRLAMLVGGFHASVFAMALLGGYPKMMPETPGQLFLSVLPFAVGLYVYGTRIAKQVQSSSSQLDRLQSMAATDALTGLTNRRQFNTRLQGEISRCRRHETPLSLALFDLDDFKKLNDFYGHQVGDRILREMGKLILQNIRESDIPARYGGEEFALILPETNEQEAADLMERLRAMVAQNVYCLPENPLTVTISIGVAQLDPLQHTAFELIELADMALYEAKNEGKNRVVRGSKLAHKVLLDKREPENFHG